MELYLKVWQNGLNFEGRARRKEFWIFFLFNILTIIALVWATGAISPIFRFALIGYVLAMLIPYFAVAVRRMHDTGKSGANLLFYFVPIVGGLIVLVMLVTEGDKGPNKYGLDPKQEGRSIEDEILDADLDL